jgi:hypothetical protein
VNWLAHLLIRAFEKMFAVGVLGSFLVLTPTTVEDIKELFRGVDKASAH